MICPKLEFEIIYSPILNFSQVYKEKIGPFIRLASNININNENSLKETIRITFSEEKLDIACNLDRIIFRTQGDLERLTKSSQSPVRIVFDILQAIKQLNGFDEIRAYVFTVNYLNPTDKSEDVLEVFSKKFLSANEFLRDFSDSGYHEVVLARNQKKIQDFIAVSTYLDGLKHEKLNDAFLFDISKVKEYINDQKGYHFYFNRIDESISAKKPDFNLFKKLVEESYQLNNRLFNDNII